MTRTMGERRSDLRSPAREKRKERVGRTRVQGGTRSSSQSSRRRRSVVDGSFDRSSHGLSLPPSLSSPSSAPNSKKLKTGPQALARPPQAARVPAVGDHAPKQAQVSWLFLSFSRRREQQQSTERRRWRRPIASPSRCRVLPRGRSLSPLPRGAPS